MSQTKTASNQQIADFQSITGASEDLARSYLKRFDFEAAVQQWFDNDGKALEEESSEPADPTSSFMSITGSTIEQATNFLQRFTNNVEAAVSQWFETGGDFSKLQQAKKPQTANTKPRNSSEGKRPSRKEKIDPPKINPLQAGSEVSKVNKPETGPFILFALKALHESSMRNNSNNNNTNGESIPLDIVYYIVKNFIVGGMREFVYVSDFDQNGILYYLGTQMGIENVYIVCFLVLFLSFFLLFLVHFFIFCFVIVFVIPELNFVFSRFLASSQTKHGAMLA
jgi:hypothetical protein